MHRFASIAGGMVIAILALAIAGVVYLRTTGLTTRAEPGVVETRLARSARALAIPAAARERTNPVARTPEALAEGMAHFADHCASCHANDGSGNTELGQGFYPKAPDMRLPATQGLTDGELFYIIENGIRFTGMPAWGTGTPEGEASSWSLVQFIRHLPGLTIDEVARMESLNPRPPAEIRRQIEEERFLAGEPVP
ncbi:MAG: cytochrome c [Vicinamibacterales bacterium]